MNNSMPIKDADYMGPEGLEERVKHCFGMFITQMQGQRYRTYVVNSDGSTKPLPKTHNDLQEAIKSSAEHMMLLGALISDPKETIKSLLEGM